LRLFYEFAEARGALPVSRKSGTSWQTICFLRWEPVNIKIKTKIRYNGQEYSDPSQLPPEVRAAYEKAMNGDARSTSNRRVKRKFVVNGQQFASEDEMSADVPKLCDDVMSVIENNGEVTLPHSQRQEPLITRRQLLSVVVVVGVLLAIALTVLATR
jgi:ribosomal protein L28